MSRSTVAVAIALCLTGASACAPTMATQGFQAVDNKPQDIKAGADTRASVLSKLGSPTTSGAFDNNTWYYINQTTEKYVFYTPRVQKRDVVAITFDKADKVVDVKELFLKDGYQIAYDGRETPTRGRELNWLEQLLGNIGRGGGMLPQDYDPGQQRPGTGGGGGGHY
ncbi:outer membrane protein assembly factor BamE [Caulobacter sp. S45]|jgi:outer membrane protein assembly factor BamE (lipoprotein component of BamABCDE complex)|uniref:outer membrane protein assembly factor BamE n=1 Tax=Caulobacter sp. S45 TaxID=1641861 RepID=UPI00131E08F5|nr:outer membrane protein assembly factor BamE [Caulobacter sp. S45]